jgi:hypothetical protein
MTGRSGQHNWSARLNCMNEATRTQTDSLLAMAPRMARNRSQKDEGSAAARPLTLLVSGGPCRIRTCDQRIKRPVRNSASLNDTPKDLWSGFGNQRTGRIPAPCQRSRSSTCQREQCPVEALCRWMGDACANHADTRVLVRDGGADDRHQARGCYLSHIDASRYSTKAQ